MMMGTKLWFGLYGDALSSESVFEKRMEAVAFELGDRGRLGLEIEEGTVCATVSIVQHVRQQVVDSELTGLKVAELRKRAKAAGVALESVEDALDADEPKSALISLIMACEPEVRGASTVVAVLAGGGAASVGVLVPALEHGAEVLDILSTSTPRRGRKALLELLERVEACVESVDASWCDGLAQCKEAQIADLSSLLAAVQLLDGGQCDVSAAVSAVSALLECLERCGSVLLQSLGVLGSAGRACEDVRLAALETLRVLPSEPQGVVCAMEVGAVGMLLGHMSEEYGVAVRVSAGLAVFSLVCRNDVNVNDILAEIEEMAAWVPTAFRELTAASRVGSCVEELRLASTMGMVWGLFC
jgi:hypothetical protein